MKKLLICSSVILGAVTLFIFLTPNVFAITCWSKNCSLPVSDPNRLCVSSLTLVCGGNANACQDTSYDCSGETGCFGQNCICISDGSCSAPPPPACEVTTTGVDNCGGACSKTGPSCVPPPPPPPGTLYRCSGAGTCIVDNVNGNTTDSTCGGFCAPPPPPPPPPGAGDCTTFEVCRCQDPYPNTCRNNNQDGQCTLTGPWPCTQIDTRIQSCDIPNCSAGYTCTGGICVVPNNPSCGANFSPPTILFGQNTTLSMTSSNDSDGVLPYNCTGNLGSGTFGYSGSLGVWPNATQTCTFSATNGATTNTCQATVTVNPSGTVAVNSNLGTSGTVTGPATLNFSGSSFNYYPEPTGTYSLNPSSLSNIAGYQFPPIVTVNPGSGTLVSGGTVTFTITYVSNETLSATLFASPKKGYSPLSSFLSANLSGTAVGNTNYSFWWNCTETSTSVSTVEGVCGALPAPAVGSCASNFYGYKCNSIPQTSKSTSNNSYSSSSRAKLIVERGSAPPFEISTPVTVLAPAPPIVSDVGISEPNYCQQGPGGIISWTFGATPADATAPVVTAFDVQPRTTTGSVTATFSATDSGGSHLSQADLWRAVYSAGSCTASNNSGCTWAVVSSIDGNNLDSWSGSMTDSPPSGTTYVYALVVYDNSSNYGVQPAQIEVTVRDTTNPVVTAFDVQPRVNNGSITATFTATDSGGSHLYQANLWRAVYAAGSCTSTFTNGCTFTLRNQIYQGGGVDSWSDSMTDTLTVGESYVYGLSVFDTDGNYGVQQAYIDIGTPIITLLSGPSGSFSQNMISNPVVPFAAPGTYTFIVSSNMTLTLRGVAGGGGGALGGDNSTGTTGGAGGGGGAYIGGMNLALVTGKTYTLVVGAGGLSDTDGNDTYLVDGVTTYFHLQGGRHGLRNMFPIATGGAGGVVFVGTGGGPGNIGGDGRSLYSGTPGGSGTGPGGGGGGGGINVPLDTDGAGGGSGGTSTAPSYAGGAGGNGTQGRENTRAASGIGGGNLGYGGEGGLHNDPDNRPASGGGGGGGGYKLPEINAGYGGGGGGGGVGDAAAGVGGAGGNGAAVLIFVSAP